MGILSGTGILDGTGILSGRGILFQPGILTPSLMDDNAAAYISAVEAAGATVTGAQRTFINDFYVAAKADYYTSLKRLYFPIWGVAAANAIDMIGLTSGTFVGGVTHASGYITGNGTTGYFNAANFGTLGLTKTDFHSVVGIKQIGSDGHAYWGLGNSRFTAIRRNSATEIQRSYCGSSTTPAAVPSSIISTTVNASRLLSSRRSSGGYSSLENIAVPAGTFPTGNVFVMAYNIGGDNGVTNTPVISGTSQIGFVGFGTSLTDAQNESYSLHLKTLYEGSTGISLP
jgi:hypothetical protein